MEYFKPYFQNTVYGLNMVLGIECMANAQGRVYIMALDIQDIHTNVRYDFSNHIIDMIHNEMVAVQVEGVQNFKFHQYSFLMHMIFFYNKDIVGPHFVEAIDEFKQSLLVQLWTKFCNRFYPYPNSIMFYNEFVNPILGRLGVVVDQMLLRKIQMW